MPPKRKQTKAAAKEASSDEYDSDPHSEQEKEIPKKKARRGEDAEKDDGAASKPAAKAKGKGNDDNDKGEEYTLQLDGKKKLTVSKFKNQTLISIREYCTDKKDGLEKPGKKGIAISPETWEALKKNIAEVDQAVERLGK